ncbi:MAG: hypothetical protein HY331_10980 [Chloroflexi bacterium]|nr:hypothetical protein [Chloroflexota bacterium]
MSTTNSAEVLLAHVEHLLSGRRQIEELTADECEDYAEALMEALRVGLISRELYEAIEDGLDRRCTAERGIVTIL